MKKLAIILLLTIGFGMESFGAKNATVNKPILKVKLLNSYPGSGIISPIYDILNEKYEVIVVNAEKSSEKYDLIIDGVYGNAPMKPNEKAIKMYYTAEAILPDLKDYDLTLGFDYIDDPRYFRLPYYYLSGLWADKLVANSNTRLTNGTCNPNKKNFACFLVSNGYTNDTRTNNPLDGVKARDHLFHKLSSSYNKKVLSGGRHLNNIGRNLEISETMEWLSNCKFVIAYENQTHNGYMTEKLFQAYFAGAIPIYYGDKTAVLQDINKDAIIYAGDFNTEDDLVDYIKKVDNDDSLYCDIWNKNLLIDPSKDWSVVKDKLRTKILQLLDEKLKK
ncbi:MULTISPECIES: glycosyltransferase family 10 domain-containing protein [unclassified Rickettsia]|uniref:glycosyltransferase family 10 domain-containing protein n=1 Tax=unclassified Rickettsia TaxID=114295 RepID=UPI003133488E